MTCSSLRGWPVALALLLCAGRVDAQTLLERTPNVSGGWVGAPNSVHFNFLHRFNQSGAPQRQVTNRPTFLLAYAPRSPLLVGAHYATRSDVAPNYPNEWEAFARYGILSQGADRPVDLAVQVGYNQAAESVDGELSLARRIGPLRVLGAARAFSSGYREDARYALAGGAALRLGNWFALAGDVGTLIDAADNEEMTWGAAVQLGIPLTPHSVSLQATNTNSSTLQGASKGSEEIRWGFEFTVPVALGRYFGPRQAPVAAAPPPNTDSIMRVAIADSVTRVLRAEFERRAREDSLRIVLRDDAARLQQQLAAVRAQARADSIREAEAAAARAEAARAAAERAAAEAPRRIVRTGMRNLAYEQPTIEIESGTTVVWRNNDQVVHTVTAVDRSWDSGNIQPGASWQRTFSQPGRYEIFCTPHPFMRAVVIVRP